jgi:hypothetical protein
MNKKDPEDQLTARINVKCHPNLLKAIRRIAKNSGVSATSTLVRMWLIEAAERELAKEAKAKRSYVNI